MLSFIYDGLYITMGLNREQQVEPPRSKIISRSHMTSVANSSGFNEVSGVPGGSMLRREAQVIQVQYRTVVTHRKFNV